MKTLDEVIKAIEYCLNPVDELGNCNGDCPYCPSCDPEGKIVKLDALHYLKEYRSDKLQWEADRKLWKEKSAEFVEKQDKLIEAAKGFQKAKAEMEEISADYVALKQWWTEQQENLPLSWDELKDMEGKPVWVECKYFFCPQWVILTNVYDEKAMFIGDRIVDSELKEEMGDVWQAYRKERK